MPRYKSIIGQGWYAVDDAGNTVGNEPVIKPTEEPKPNPVEVINVTPAPLSEVKQAQPREPKVFIPVPIICPVEGCKKVLKNELALKIHNGKFHKK